MVAAAVGGLLVALGGVAFIWLGREIVAGRVAPAVGGRTQENTTPDSWHEVSEIVGTEVERCGRGWIFAAIVLVPYAPAGAAILLASSVLLAAKAAVAATQLVPLNTEP